MRYSSFVANDMIDPEFWEYIKEIVEQHKKKQDYFYHKYPLDYLCEYKDDEIQ